VDKNIFRGCMITEIFYWNMYFWIDDVFYELVTKFMFDTKESSSDESSLIQIHFALLRIQKMQMQSLTSFSHRPYHCRIIRICFRYYNSWFCVIVAQNDGGILPSSTTYTGGLGSVVGGHGGHHVRRSLPDMGAAPTEPPKLYPYHLLVITNYRLPADVDRCNLEVSANYRFIYK